MLCCVDKKRSPGQVAVPASEASSTSPLEYPSLVHLVPLVHPTRRRPAFLLVSAGFCWCFRWCDIFYRHFLIPPFAPPGHSKPLVSQTPHGRARCSSSYSIYPRKYHPDRSATASLPAPGPPGRSTCFELDRTWKREHLAFATSSSQEIVSNAEPFLSSCPCCCAKPDWRPGYWRPCCAR